MDNPGCWLTNVLVRREDAGSSEQIDFGGCIKPKFYNVFKVLSSFNNRGLPKLSHENTKLTFDYFYILVSILKDS